MYRLCAEILDHIQHPVIAVEEKDALLYANAPAKELLRHSNIKELMNTRFYWVKEFNNIKVIEFDDLTLPQRLVAENVDYIFDQLDDAVHIVDSRGYTVVYNRACAELDGVSRSDALNRSIFDLYPNLEKEKSSFFRVLEEGCEMLRHENTYYSKNGKRIDAISSTIPLNIHGRRYGAAEVVHSIVNIKMLSERILDLHDRLTKAQRGKKATGARFTFKDLIGKNESFCKSVEMARRVAGTDLPVLIYGETGTGKELFAQGIHNASSNRHGPFVAVNCAAIPNNLLESMLFGTVKGAFTGAQNRSGVLEHAAGGTVFFDEVQSLRPELQAKLLRVLQDGYFQRVGGVESIPMQARVLSAMNIPPEEAVARGLLREDLYYRLSVFKISIPPLRERKDDIPLLVEHFISKHNCKTGKKIKGVTAETMQLFYDYDWPGNVRELEHLILAQAVIMPQDAELLSVTPEAMGPFFKKQPAMQEDHAEKSLNNSLDEIERDMIIKSLKENGCNITRTAKALGVTRQGLQYKMARLNIKLDRLGQIHLDSHVTSGDTNRV